MQNFDTVKLSTQLEVLGPEEILSWAWQTFRPKIAVSSSFQTQSVPLLHMVSKKASGLRILFLDTGFHFPATLAFRDRLIREFGLNVVSLRTRMGHDGFLIRYGELYRSDPDLCCFINKVEPIEQAMSGVNAWISGIRRDQTPERGETPIISQLANGLYKVAPLATWTKEQVHRYIEKHELPAHPMTAMGYKSIGCAPCTRAVKAGEDSRAGRWSGLDKRECGLHADYFAQRPKTTLSPDDK